MTLAAPPAGRIASLRDASRMLAHSLTCTRCDSAFLHAPIWFIMPDSLHEERVQMVRRRKGAKEMTVEEFEDWCVATDKFAAVAEAADEVGGPRLSLVPLPEQDLSLIHI